MRWWLRGSVNSRAFSCCEHLRTRGVWASRHGCERAYSQAGIIGKTLRERTNTHTCERAFHIYRLGGARMHCALLLLLLLLFLVSCTIPGVYSHIDSNVPICNNISRQIYRVHQAHTHLSMEWWREGGSVRLFVCTRSCTRLRIDKFH